MNDLTNSCKIEQKPNPQEIQLRNVSLKLEAKFGGPPVNENLHFHTNFRV